jgi:hypothetical protein
VKYSDKDQADDGRWEEDREDAEGTAHHFEEVTV